MFQVISISTISSEEVIIREEIRVENLEHEKPLSTSDEEKEVQYRMRILNDK